MKVTKNPDKKCFIISDGVTDLSIDYGYIWGVIYDILRLSKSRFMLSSIEAQCHALKTEFSNRNELEN